MSELANSVWVLIPIVAIIGGLGYATFEKWSDIEEKRHAMQVASGGNDLQLRFRRREDDLVMLRTELNDTVKDVDDRLLRIEILLREVE